MNSFLAKMFATILRRKIIQEDDGTKSIKWYHSETVLAGIAVGVHGVYLIAQQVAKEQFGTDLPDASENILGFINLVLGGTVVWGRTHTTIAKIVK